MPKPKRTTSAQKAPGGTPGIVIAHLGVAVDVETHGAQRHRVRVHRDHGLVVGDDVLVDVDNERIELVPRRTALKRRSPGGGVHVVAANLDVLLVVAAVDPPARAGLVDRAAVAARAAGVDAVLVVNKIDLPDPNGVVDAMRARAAGELALLPVSASTGEGVDAVSQLLRARGRGALVGPSGVGKSSLLNRLLPSAALATTGLSDARGAGMHTTTKATLWRLPEGGELVDTPGVREYGLVDVPPADLALYFPAFSSVAGSCRFRDCLHEEEPGCAVRAALASGDVPEARYVAYRNLLNESRDDRRR